MRGFAWFFMLSVTAHAAALALGLPWHGHAGPGPEKTVTVELVEMTPQGPAPGKCSAGGGMEGTPRPVKNNASARSSAVNGPNQTVPNQAKPVKPDECAGNPENDRVKHLRYVSPDMGSSRDIHTAHTASSPRAACGLPASPAGHTARRGGGGSSHEYAGGLEGNGAAAGGAGPCRGFGERGGPGIVRLARPRYPALARRFNKSGSVVLVLGIDEDGGVEDVTVASPAGFGFDEAAVDAVRRSKFAPATSKDRPVACVAKLTIRFELGGPGL